MDLKDKLKYYQPVINAGTEAKTAREEGKKPDLFSLLDALPVDASAADVLKLDNFFPYDNFFHGFAVKHGEDLKLPLLSRGQWQDPVYASDVLIFDLETTGLAGGAGTFPFLIGLGMFEPEGVRVIQYFLPDYGREIIAYLDMLNLTGDKRHLLSFNGKSYDYPLLKNRFILNRIDNPFVNYNHIDLLHFARRLWKNNLVSCSLETIEQEIFYFHRFQDIDGWMIPQAYFDFLRTGQVEDIRKIIRHNQQDIVSLGRLLYHLHHLEMNISLESISESELRSLFNLAVQNSDMNAIQLILEQFSLRRMTLSGPMLVEYSLLLKRLGEWERAIIIWEQILASGSHILFALEELAKYHEHRSGQLGEARRLTERALKYIEMIKEIRPGERSKDVEEQFQYRNQRIQRKQKAADENFINDSD